MSEKLLTSWCCRSVSAVFKRTRGATNPFLLSLLCFDATFDDEKKVGRWSFLLQKVSPAHGRHINEIAFSQNVTL